MQKIEIRATLEKVLKKLEVIDAKVSGMPQVQVQVSSRFLPSLNALSNLGSGTASQVSRVTGRSRAFESKSLNELHAMGVVDKQRCGRAKVFLPKQRRIKPRPTETERADQLVFGHQMQVVPYKQLKGNVT